MERGGGYRTKEQESERIVIHVSSTKIYIGTARVDLPWSQQGFVINTSEALFLDVAVGAMSSKRELVVFTFI